MKSKRNLRKNLFRVILIFIFVILLVLAAYLQLKLKKLKEYKVNNKKEDVFEDLYDQGITWEEYVNPEYGISFSRPKFLYLRETKNQGGYEYFARFEENEFSTARGIALGIRKISFEEEVERLKKELESDFDVRLIRQDKLRIDKRDAVRLDYEPSKKTEFEPRSIVFVGKGDLTYSISTVPEQINGIIDSLKLLSSTESGPGGGDK